MVTDFNNKTYSQWIMTTLFIILCSLFISVSADAQTFTQRVQQNNEGEGSVVIEHSAFIDDLVNNAQTAAPKQPEKTTTTAKSQPITQPTKAVTPKEENNGGTQNTDSITYKRYRTTGYRVQVFRGGNSKNDRQQAEAASSKIKNAYPDEDIYVEFFSPDWTCRVGNYREIEDARRMRDQLRKMGFDAATIVKGKIIISIPQQ